MNPEQLSDSELDRLSDVLERFGSKRAMNIEQLDGFLAALVCSHDEVPKANISARFGVTI
jgi:yecA family protein